MTYATVFSGIGGWEIGLNRCGWELKWQCEKDQFCAAVLRERFGVPICPNVIMLFEWLETVFGSLAGGGVDALVGSPPCQPFSVAGSQLGIGDHRHLFPIFAKIVGKLRPRFVLLEQVPAILANEAAFGEYLWALAALGYDAAWHCIPASAVGAPHQRDRVWIIAADAQNDRWSGAIRGHVADSPETCWPRRLQQAGALDPRLALFRAIEQSVGESAGLSRFDGNTTRLECELAAYGNAVVPQIPFLIGKAINDVMKRMSERPTSAEMTIGAGRKRQE